MKNREIDFKVSLVLLFLCLEKLDLYVLDLFNVHVSTAIASTYISPFQESLPHHRPHETRILHSWVSEQPQFRDPDAFLSGIGFLWTKWFEKLHWSFFSSYISWAARVYRVTI